MDAVITRLRQNYEKMSFSELRAHLQNEHAKFIHAIRHGCAGEWKASNDKIDLLLSIIDKRIDTF